MKCLLVGILPILLAWPVAATTLISNLPISVGGFTSNFAVANNLATGFVMPGASYGLDSVTLQLTVFSNFSSVAVSLYGGTASAPSGAALATFNNPAFTANGSSNPYAFTPTSATTLQASTNYWIVLDGNGSSQNSVTWDGSSPAVTATGLATFLGQTSDGSLPPITALTVGATNRLVFQVDGTLPGSNVPEPATFGLMAGCLALMFVTRRSGMLR